MKKDLQPGGVAGQFEQPGGIELVANMMMMVVIMMMVVVMVVVMKKHHKDLRMRMMEKNSRTSAFSM